jgi:hypothetical protein
MLEKITKTVKINILEQLIVAHHPDQNCQCLLFHKGFSLIVSFFTVESI